jgi:hypothetical protein
MNGEGRRLLIFLFISFLFFYLYLFTLVPYHSYSFFFFQLKVNILASVWRSIGKVDNPELVSLAVKCCLKKSIESGIGSMRSDIIGEIVYTMAAENSPLVGGKVIAKTLKVKYRGGANEKGASIYMNTIKGMEQTAQKPTSDLAESEVWPKLSVLLRYVLHFFFSPHPLQLILSRLACSLFWLSTT